jgi:very-short-patch-repair endonuclease
MGIKEAREDGIRFKINSGGCNWFYPLCHICGEEVPNWNYRREIKYTCNKCKLENKLADKVKKECDDYELKERKFGNAVERIMKVVPENQKAKYKEASEAVHDKLHTAGWFDSTEEIMVAIECLKRRIRIRHQVKFGTRYRADFVIESMKVVLEVDGVCYHNKYTKEKEELRDSLIVAALGPEWEVVRITDVLINENITKLVPAIKEVVKRRKLVREKYGYLPEWYTDRKMA